MAHRVAAIIRYTTLEALRTRLPLLVALVVLGLFGASFFVREITIAESLRFQAGFYAATARFAAVVLTTLYVIASISREFHDKGLELVLALDLPRSQYILGKFGGFLTIAWAICLACALPLVFLSTGEALLQWLLSLAAEIAVVTALSLFCVTSFTQLVPATSVVVAFYLLARTITAIRLIGENPVAGADALSHQVMTWFVEALALVVPAFDRWTQTAWLVNEPANWSTIVAIVTHGALFSTVLAAAAMFDFYRRNF